MRATLEELARSDYSGLSIEKVAARAGVNKTTVYRHWPTRVELVHAAISSVAQSHDLGPSTGSLRADLMRAGRNFLDYLSSFEGQCLTRLGLMNHGEPELAEIARKLNSRVEQQLRVLAREAIARGELSEQADIELLLDMLGGALLIRLFMKDARVDEVLISRIVDVLLQGAPAPTARPPAPRLSRPRRAG